MQIAPDSRLRGEPRRVVRSTASSRAVFALCAFSVLPLALPGCAKKLPPPPAASPAPPPSVDSLHQLRLEIDALLDRPGHQRGIWGVAIHSLSRGDRVYERNPRTLLIPASTLKLVTLAAAAEAVGWDFTFETTLQASGPIENGVLKGDLVIVGTGDPTILGRPGGAGFGPWIDALRRWGLTRIDGGVVADDDLVEEPAPGFIWSWDDLATVDGAVAGALNLRENVFAVTVSPGPAPGLPTVVEPHELARGLFVINRSRTVAPGAPFGVWPELQPGETAVSIKGTLAADSPSVVVNAAAPNPTLWFAHAFRNELLGAGIDVTGAAVDVDDIAAKPAGGTPLHVHRSPPLAEIAAPLVKDSINLHAEAVLRLATGRDGPRVTGAALDAVRRRFEAWGIPREGIQIVDGSGLSRRNVLAAETLTTVLQRFHDPGGASPFMLALAVAGRDGTLRSRLKGTAAEGNAMGKTGSLSNVRALAGYVTTADNEPLAFAILANNFEGEGRAVTATIDRVVTRLASFSRTASLTH